MNLESCGCTRSNGRTPARNLSRQLLSIPVSPRLTTTLPVYTPGLGKVRNQRACSQTSSDFIGKRRMTPRRLRKMLQERRTRSEAKLVTSVELVLLAELFKRKLQSLVKTGIGVFPCKVAK